jgi:hypothetical protein
MKKLIMAAVLASSIANAKVPAWAASNSTKLTGSLLTTVCHGVGPSVDIARSEALTSCQLNASQFFKSKINVKTLSIETEKSVGFHQEISSDDEVSNLVCEPVKDELEESESQYSFWIECKFDISKTKSKPTEAEIAIEKNENNNLSYSKPSKVEPNKLTKTLFLSTVPKCESIIIKGDRPRTIDCKSNPIELSIYISDVEMIVRAKNYKPKTISLKNKDNNENLQILLDK